LQFPAKTYMQVFTSEVFAVDLKKRE
jgi:hypothetical protein